MKYLFFIFITFSILIVGCSKTTSKRPVTKINIENNTNNTFVFGQDISVNLKYQSKVSQLKSIEFYLDNQLINSTINASELIIINSKKLLPGNHVLKTIATTQKGVSGTNYRTISILSDVPSVKGSFELKKTLTHDVKNFTQGLEFYQGLLFEGTGNYGESRIQAYHPITNKLVHDLSIDSKYFGEGITIFNGKIYQLTYKSKKVLVYDVSTFEKINEFTFDSKEGWGLTHNDRYLIMSDGTSKIHFIEPENFKTVKSIEVCNHRAIIDRINELEYVDGFIYANIWMTQQIVKIDANTGRVFAYYNMHALSENINTYNSDVLNGIAFEPEEKLFYITGKYWPNIFVVEFSE